MSTEYSHINDCIISNHCNVSQRARWRWRVTDGPSVASLQQFAIKISMHFIILIENDKLQGVFTHNRLGRYIDSFWRWINCCYGSTGNYLMDGVWGGEWRSSVNSSTVKKSIDTLIDMHHWIGQQSCGQSGSDRLKGGTRAVHHLTIVHCYRQFVYELLPLTVLIR